MTQCTGSFSIENLSGPALLRGYGSRDEETADIQATMARQELARIASVSLGFPCKKSLKNGIFEVLAARKWGESKI